MTNLETVRRFYDALHEADGDALMGLLHRHFEGSVTDGLPPDLGGRYAGRARMLALWRDVLTHYDVRPIPDELVVGRDGRVVAVGRYVGRAVRSGMPFEAAFIHVIGVDRDKLTSLHQVTDSVRWAEALAPPGDGGVAVVKRVMDAVRDRHIETILGLYAPEIEIHEADGLPYGGHYRGHGGAVEHGLRYVAAWDSLQLAEDRETSPSFFSAPGGVAVVWRQKGRRGERRLDVPAVSLFELSGGKVVRLRMFHTCLPAVAEFLSAA